MNDWIDSAELARLLRIDQHQLLQLVGEGKLPRPVVLGAGAPQWPRATIGSWLMRRMCAELASPKM
jgi:predicted DNA-binding transcriptional regulator AlpA